MTSQKSSHYLVNWFSNIFGRLAHISKMNGVIAVIVQGVVIVLVDGDVDASVKHADGVAHCPKPRVLFIRVVVITHSRSSVGSGGKSLVVILIQFHRCSRTQGMTDYGVNAVAVVFDELVCGSVSLGTMNHMKRYEGIIQDVSGEILRPRYVQGLVLWMVV